MAIKINNEPKYVRRRIAVAIIFVATFLGVSKATSDVCWTGSGYGSCQKMIDDMLAKQEAERKAIEEAKAEALRLELAKTTAPLFEVQSYAKKLAWNEYKWGDKQFACLDLLWTKESNWRSNAVSKTHDHGIPQRNMPDASKDQRLDFLADPKSQIEWGLNYISERYGSPCQALDFHERRNWY